MELHYQWMTQHLIKWHYPNKQQLEYSSYALPTKKSQQSVYELSIKNEIESNLSPL